MEIFPCNRDISASINLSSNTGQIRLIGYLSFLFLFIPFILLFSILRKSATHLLLHLAESIEAIGNIRRFIKIPYSPGISRGRPRLEPISYTLPGYCVYTVVYRVNRERHSPRPHRVYLGIYAIYIRGMLRFFLIYTRGFWDKRATRVVKRIAELDGEQKSANLTPPFLDFLHLRQSKQLEFRRRGTERVSNLSDQVRLVEFIQSSLWGLNEIPFSRHGG